MGWWKWLIVPVFKSVGKALSKAFDKVAGQAFTLGCLIISGESLRQIKNNHAATKVTQHLGKNTCNMAFSTASGGSVYRGYSYEAKGDGLECNDLPERKVIEKEVKICARRFKDHSVDSGCCEKTIGKAHWQIRVSRDTKLHPVAKVTC